MVKLIGVFLPMQNFFNKLMNFFIPSYENMIEIGENKEEIIVKSFYIPIGFILFIGVMIAWSIKSC